MDQAAAPATSTSQAQAGAPVKSSFLPTKGRFILVSLLEAGFYACLVSFFIAAREHNRAAKPRGGSQERVLQSIALAFMICTTVWNGLMLLAVIPLSFWNRLWWAYCPFFKPLIFAHMSPTTFARFQADYAEHGFAFGIVHAVLFCLPSVVVSGLWLAKVSHSTAALGCFLSSGALLANMATVDLKCCIEGASNVSMLSATKTSKAE